MKFPKFFILFAILSCRSVIGKSHCYKGYKPCAVDNICCCMKSRAVCQDQLTYIPALPGDITELTFRNNFLPSIDRSSFDNISNLNLTSLKILTCKVVNVSEDAFSTLRVLSVLALDDNYHLNQTQLSQALGSIKTNSNITLSLKNVGLTDVETNLFHYITGANITNLNLDENKLTFLDFKSFQELRILDTLSVKSNFIRAIDKGNGHKTLTKVILRGNEFARFVPAFCSDNINENLFPRLGTLDLSDNFINILYNKSWNCLKTLRSLKLGGNVVRTVKANTFSDLTNLFELSFSGMASSINDIEKYAFNNSHLTTLNLQENSIAFKPHDSAGIFLGCNNLAKLIISGNNFNGLTDDDMVRMFSPLKNLEDLNAVDCNIKEFPFRLVSSLKHLRKLILDQNRIENLSDLLYSAGNLSYLSMQSNKIRTLQKKNFPMDPHSNMTLLNLAVNQFDCTCDLLWFRSTVKNDGTIGNFRLVSWPHRYTCTTPKSRAKTRVFDYKPTEISCKNVLLISVLCVSSFALVIAVIASLSYKYRWYISLWRYKLTRNKRPPERQALLGVETGQFRGYVIYDSCDGSFVETDLRKLVEQDMSYKLKIWERDASVGGSKLEEMVDSIYASETVLAVISKSSLENDWVRFQIEVALDRQVELRRNFLILVLLEDLVYKAMPNYWCVMFTRLPAARWCANTTDVKWKVFEQQLQQHFDTGSQYSIQ